MKRSPEKLATLCKLLATGASRAACADALRISEATLYEWLKLPEIAESLKEAEAQAEHSLLAIIREAAPKQWQAAAWILERRWRDRWGRYDRPGAQAEEAHAPSPEARERLILDAADEIRARGNAQE